MLYLHHPYTHWEELYYRFVAGKLDLPDQRLNARWDRQTFPPDCLTDQQADVVIPVRNIGFRRRIHRRGQPGTPAYDCVVYDLAVSDPDAIRRLGREMRLIRTAMPDSWYCAAVALMPAADRPIRQLAKDERVHILTCMGLYTPYDSPIPFH